MDTMQRNRIISAGGTSFFSQFRNGFRTILAEVSKLETILADPEQPLESPYFEVESAILENANLHYDNVHELHTTVTQEPINLDSIEERLQAIRSKLISLEEDPAWLKKGYQPYVPPETAPQIDEASTPERANGSAVMELSFGTPPSANGNGAYPLAPQTPNLSANSIESAGCTPKPVSHSGTGSSNGSTTCLNQTKQLSQPPAPKPEPEILISDPKLAKCLNILNRWKNVDSSADPMVRKDTFIKATDEESSVASLKGTAFPLSNKKPASFSASPTVPTLTSESLIKSLNQSAHKFKPTAASIHRSKTFTMESKAKVKPFTGGQFDYETVEFTPGMTSKVIRK